METIVDADGRESLGRIYGAAAALIQNDREGAGLLLDDARWTGVETASMLVAISFATLDRLGAALEGGKPDPQHDLARDLLDRALGFRSAPPEAVHSAAWRLEAVGRRDCEQAGIDVDRSRVVGTDAQLLLGAVGLLAAVVEFGADRRGRDATRDIRRLCLACAAVD